MLVLHLFETFHRIGIKRCVNCRSVPLRESRSVLASTLLILPILSSCILGAEIKVDQTFQAGSGLDGPVLCHTLDKLGRIYIGGRFAATRGAVRPALARLLKDGRADPSFRADIMTTNTELPNLEVRCVQFDSNGKLLIGGLFDHVGQLAQASIARLDVDGAVDLNFRPKISGIVNCIINQPDGRIVVGGVFEEVNGFNADGLCRLNVDGTLDQSFKRFERQVFDSVVDVLAVDKNGLVLVGGNVRWVNSRADPTPLIRLHSNGTLDEVFNQSIKAELGTIHALQLYPDGRILAGGDLGVRRFMNNGNLDQTFSTPFSFVRSLLLLPTSKVLIGYESSGDYSLARVETDGMIDRSFRVENVYSVETVGIVSSNRIFYGGFGASQAAAYTGIAELLNLDGGIDSEFRTYDWSFDFSAPFNAMIEDILPLPDGKVLVAGPFTQVSGKVREGIAKLNADGSLDESFATGVRVLGIINALAIQEDGKILAAGDFSGMYSTDGDSTGPAIARFNSDGRIDSTFESSLIFPLIHVECIRVMADGSILLGGSHGLTLLHKDGARFDPNPGEKIRGSVAAAIPISDGKIIVGGSIAPEDWIFGEEFGALILGRDGQVSQVPSLQSDSLGGKLPSVYDMAVESSGTVLAVGTAEVGPSVFRSSLVRFHPTLNRQMEVLAVFDGGAPLKIEMGSDGTFLVGGDFEVVNGIKAPGLVRFLPTGALDRNFDIGAGPESQIYFEFGTHFKKISRIAVEPDGRILVGGNFSTFGGSPRQAIVRLLEQEVAEIATLHIRLDNGSGVVLVKGAQGRRIRFEESMDLRSWSEFQGELVNDGDGEQSFSLDLGRRELGFIRAIVE